MSDETDTPEWRLSCLETLRSDLTALLKTRTDSLAALEQQRRMLEESIRRLNTDLVAVGLLLQQMDPVLGA